MRISVCKGINCNELITDYEVLHCEGYCFFCFEEYADKKQEVIYENK